MIDTLKLWNSVERTDPAFTKHVTEGGRKYTAISPYYLIKKATEVWGPIGLGWGFDITDSYFTEGSPFAYEFSPTQEPVVIPTEMHTARVRLWYMDEDRRAEVEDFGHTPFVFNTSKGPKTDFEAPKKSVTDALKKCLSMVGFSADVFLGLFDDELYREDIKEHFALEKADNRVEMEEQQRAEFAQYVSAHKELLATALGIPELEQIYRVVVRKLTYRNEKELIKEFSRIKDKRKAELGGALQ